MRFYTEFDVKPDGYCPYCKVPLDFEQTWEGSKYDCDGVCADCPECGGKITLNIITSYEFIKEVR